MFGLIRREPTFVSYNPFRELEAMERALFSTQRTTMRTDITDQGDAYLLEAELPGYEKKDISLEVLEDTLTIRAERREEKEDTKYLHSERSWGVCQRRFDLTGIKADKIKAKYKDGVLRVTLPKEEKAMPMRLEID